ncbi:MAG: putative Fe-S cluster assembly protein SufT [Verrucomicrobiota bacterium]|nr:putative Fe-S cluster assembly protein SufT [Verrucomicrobiota bacterium]
MSQETIITLSRDVEAAIVPTGEPVTLEKGQEARITQELGGAFTVIVNGNMLLIQGKHADALGREVQEVRIKAAAAGGKASAEEVEAQVWEQMKTCYDPEIPVNSVDLGLIYDCVVSPIDEGSEYNVLVKMTLTAPGCGMGPVIQQDVQNKVLCIEDVAQADVELVWEPQWSQDMMTEAARLQLGLM